MNFFEQQDIAKRNTKRLVLLLILAILSLIAIATLLIAFLMYFLQTGNSTYYLENQGRGFWGSLGTLVSWQMVTSIAAIVVTVVFFGSFYKVMQLRGGGKAVAESLGGKLIDHSTRDPDERRILNVVEEMAIASGTAVPPVYLLDDDAINAFAAGHNPQDAVIGVTRGCIRLLNRDELQGVVAHEFSHIFHGDMRLNIRLVSLLNGILLLGLIGQLMVRSSAYRSYGRSSRNNSPAFILGAGIGLMVIGYAGTFFGNLIKAAVSRQREFLADASAVQFTRNPDGISGALKKIGGYASGSRLETNNAAEFSHMYFSQGVSTAFNAMMATHPPLPERIKRIQPRWDGEYKKVEITTGNPNPLGAEQVSNFAGESVQAAPTAELGTAQLQQGVEAIGQPSAQHLGHARQLLSRLDPLLHDAAHDSFSARGLVYGLLLSRDADVRKLQWKSLQQEYTRDELKALQTIASKALASAADLRLPLIELAMPALRELSASQFHAFKNALTLLIRADQRVSLAEWAIYRILVHNLEPQAHRLRQAELRELRNECQLLLSLLAHAGSENVQQAKAAFTSAAVELRLAALELLPRNAVELPLVDKALDRLNNIKPLQKPRLLKAMSECILHDGEITTAEAELFRAIADSLDCPVPPLLPGPVQAA